MARRKSKKQLPIAAVIVISIAGWLLNHFGFITTPQPGGGEGGAGCQVKSVYDGDTMTLICQGETVKVRMYCIDAPEMKQSPWGSHARDHLRGLAGDKLSVRQIDKDRYGRVVGEVFYGQENLNLQMVRDGFVAVYPDYCKDEQYFQAEKAAKAKKSGVWNKSGLHQTPWKWREQERAN